MPGFVTKKISTRRGFGSTLKAARRRLGTNLEQAETATRIPLKYLQALEDGQFFSLPAEAYNVGYVRGYAEYLHLDPERLIQMYREERSISHHQKSNQVSFSPKKISDWHFLITPKLLGVLGMFILFGAVSGYIFNELRQFTQPPKLLLSGIESEFTTTKDLVSVKGQTSPGATVTINNEPIFVASDGSFSQDIQLSPGVNDVTVQAKTRAEKVSVKGFKALYQLDLASLPASGNSN